MTLSPKDPDVTATYSIEWRDEIIEEAARGKYFQQGTILRANRETGWLYEVTTAGVTSAHYPTFPRAAAATVADGSAVLTARHPDDVTTAAVSSAVWTAQSGITVASQTEVGTVTYVMLSGGTDGVDYDLLCRMTPTSGNVLEQTITIPVRAQ